MSKYKGLTFNWLPPLPAPVIDAQETHLAPAHLTPDEESLMSYYEELGRQAAEHQKACAAHTKDGSTR